MIQRMLNVSIIKKTVPLLSANTLLVRLADASLIAISLYIAGLVYGTAWSDIQTVAWALAAVIYAVIGEFSGVYRSFREENLSSRIGRVCSIWAITIAVLLLIAFMTKTTEAFSRVVTILWFGFTAVALSMWHGVVGTMLRIVRAKGHNLRKAAIVGVTEMSTHVAQNIKQKPWMGIEILGYYEDRQDARLPKINESIGPYLGNYNELIEKAKKGDIDIVYISLPMRAEFRINQLINRLGTTTASIYLAHNFGGFNLLPPNCAPRWSQIGDVSVLGVVESPFQGLVGWVKQLEDMLLGSIFVLLTAIPMLFIALAIKLTSKGPVFFKQTRYGLNGQKIDVLKFRTMRVCENGASIKQATKGDDRITDIGRFLRRTSLDELPQFFHVVTGKMSIVGPRPHAVAHNEQYRELIEHYMVRHKVKPGITGWAQVNGWRGETDTKEKMKKRIEYDLVYIRNWTLLLDLKIIFMTVFGSKTRQNAY